MFILGICFVDFVSVVIFNLFIIRIVFLDFTTCVFVFRFFSKNYFKTSEQIFNFDNLSISY